ncbi:hypothetical protein ATOBIA_N07020 [Atopobiaceae bacterium P1]|uniref:Uncharacterized protein n=1 Tax=Leptogranulimonas caecicola TaxID=2894156 RepID=A0AAU9D2Z8_9ACTN|nr:hypothetical protein ATOBIA_N07020 [Atopobiaceae bacterium P1]BDC90759.1 hypothetical protein ATTO_06310 [Leptogranulimonas caecicola]
MAPLALAEGAGLREAARKAKTARAKAVREAIAIKHRTWGLDTLGLRTAAQITAACLGVAKQQNARSLIGRPRILLERLFAEKP